MKVGKWEEGGAPKELAQELHCPFQDAYIARPLPSLDILDCAGACSVSQMKPSLGRASSVPLKTGFFFLIGNSNH